MFGKFMQQVYDAEIIEDIDKCGKCGQKHIGVVYKFRRANDTNAFYYGECPVTKEEDLMILYKTINQSLFA